MNTLVPIEVRAYAAGFFDGEGSLTCDGKGYLRINIYQNDKTPLVLLQTHYGGSMGLSKHTWYLCLAAKRSRIFLESVLPYLIVKHELAEAVLALGTEAEAIREVVRRFNGRWKTSSSGQV